MVLKARIYKDYKTALIMSYEEEISGEAYFAHASSFFTGRGRDALLLLAQVEAATAAAIYPLLERYGFATTNPDELRASGRAEADLKSGLSWTETVAEMVTDYPAYVEEFENLERLAPERDRKFVDVLIKHEIAAIEFAKLEAAGDQNSFAPLNTFLNTNDMV